MVRCEASLVVMYMIQLRVNGYILTGNAYENFGPWYGDVLVDYPIRQSAGMQGRLLCNGKPIKTAIRLVAEVGVDNETYGMYYWNDGLYENEATDDGVFFRVSGWSPKHRARGESTGAIDPQIEVYHRCNQEEILDVPPPENITVGNRTYVFDWNRNCVRRFVRGVPYSYVFDGMVPEKIYDIGTIDLSRHDTGWVNDSSYGFAQSVCGYGSGGCSGRYVKPSPTDKHFVDPYWGCDEEFP